MAADFYQVIWNNDADAYFNPGPYFKTYEEAIQFLKDDIAQKDGTLRYFVGVLYERNFGPAVKSSVREYPVAEQIFSQSTSWKSRGRRTVTLKEYPERRSCGNVQV